MILNMLREKDIKTCNRRVQTGFSRLRIGTGGGHLSRRRSIVGLCKTGISIWLGGTVT
jgi:hypothetical protein